MMLMGYEGLNLPYDVPANQYVNFSAGQKQSKSKGTGTWMLDLLDVYAPDVVRFYLTTVLPESNDTEFREDDLIRANNDVLIATWGNLANRVISMIHRNFGGVVPPVGELAPESSALIAEVRSTFESVGNEFEACHFRTGLQEALRLAQAANRYLDERAPWKAVKSDLPHAGETLVTALNVINSLKVLLHPVLPFSTAQLHEDLGLGSDVCEQGWTYREVPSGTTLAPARPLYTKIETELAGTTA
jgi:methionyl-tRNA synthetase